VIKVNILPFVLLASLSPLLTFAWLWQVKEWRIDRLREHLRSEGWFRQLFGTIRPVLVLMLLVLGIVSMQIRRYWYIAVIIALAALNLVQFALKKQRYPVWTQKALVLTATSILIDFVIALACLSWSPALLAVLPLAQAFVLAIAWIAFLPLDATLKNRRMSRAAQLRAQFSDLLVIGVTGSAGKTTLKELLSCILSKRSVLATPAYVNSEMGVANWMLTELSKNKDNPPEILIVEMGAYRRGEIERLCNITQPSMGAITFIGKQHMALFGSQEMLSAAKAELLEALPENGKAFLNADNDASMAVAHKAACPIVRVGTGGQADLEAFDIEETANGIAFRAGDTRFSLPLRGTHNVTNVLLAIAIARNFKMKDAEIAQALSLYKPLNHTFAVRTEKGVTILDDTHNSSPASFKAAIAWTRTQPAKQKVLLTSGLIELGQEQDHIHTELGEMAQQTFDRVVFVHSRSGRFFEKGYGKKVEVYSADTKPVEEKALLVCIGRVPANVMHRMLP
jgi:UDP-N-acetylmuramoyl-tripeptide--D-alanyl-D-alanine ligase